MQPVSARRKRRSLSKMVRSMWLRMVRSGVPPLSLFQTIARCQSIAYLDRMVALVEDAASELPALIREECQDLLAQIAEKTTRIAERLVDPTI